MPNFFNNLIYDDFIWDAIIGALPGRRRMSNTHFININCPMCVSRGESIDKKQRCGIKKNHDGVGIYCFNCRFVTRFTIGQTIPRNLHDFMNSIGVSRKDIGYLNVKAMNIKRLFTSNPDASGEIPQLWQPNYKTTSLPDGSKTLNDWATSGCDDPDFLRAVEYVYGRGQDIFDATDYYWTPSRVDGMNKRVIVPFFFRGNVVGYTGRATGAVSKDFPRYHTETQQHFLFNNRVIDLNRKFIILVEGPFDALAIDGVATLGAKLTEEQATWLKNSGKAIIVLPDPDSGGDAMIQRALDHNWMVSFPKLADGHGRDNWWDADVKDAAKATERYGKLYTLQSIISTATSQKIEINVKRKLYY